MMKPIKKNLGSCVYPAFNNKYSGHEACKYVTNIGHFLLEVYEKYKGTKPLMRFFVMGNSQSILTGSVVPVLIKEQIPFVINQVRKESDTTHHQWDWEYDLQSSDKILNEDHKGRIINIIIDDFIASGKTINREVRALQKLIPNFMLDYLIAEDSTRLVPSKSWDINNVEVYNAIQYCVS